MVISTPETKTIACQEKMLHTHTQRELLRSLSTYKLMMNQGTHIYVNQNASGDAQHLRAKVLVPQLRAVGVTGNMEQHPEKTG